MDNEQLAKLRTRLQDNSVSDDMLEELMADAEAMILGYLNRSTMPEACAGAVMRLAQALYHRLGLEGMQAHSEGGVSDTLETGIPDEIQTMLRPWRLAKVGHA